MQRPEVRVIETQYEESKTVDISTWEKEQLLAKYGYVGNQNSFESPNTFNPTKDLSYQELMELEDLKYQQELDRRRFNHNNRPITYTIDQDNVRYNETKWSNMDLGGQDFGIQVQIVSDMKFTR